MSLVGKRGVPMSNSIFNEMSDAQGIARPHYEAFDAWLKGLSADTVQVKQTEAATRARTRNVT